MFNEKLLDTASFFKLLAERPDYDLSRMHYYLSIPNSTLPFCPLQVQRQQLLQDRLIAQFGLPPIRREDGFVEALVGEIEPGGTLCWAVLG